MTFENSIKGFIFLSNLKGFSNSYDTIYLCKYKKQKKLKIIKICTINIIKIGNYIMYNNNMNRLYESYYDSVFPYFYL